MQYLNKLKEHDRIKWIFYLFNVWILIGWPIPCDCCYHGSATTKKETIAKGGQIFSDYNDKIRLYSETYPLVSAANGKNDDAGRILVSIAHSNPHHYFYHHHDHHHPSHNNHHHHHHHSSHNHRHSRPIWIATASTNGIAVVNLPYEISEHPTATITTTTYDIIEPKIHKPRHRKTTERRRKRKGRKDDVSRLNSRSSPARRRKTEPKKTNAADMKYEKLRSSINAVENTGPEYQTKPFYSPTNKIFDEPVVMEKLLYANENLLNTNNEIKQNQIGLVQPESNNNGQRNHQSEWNNAPTEAIKCDYCQPMSELKWPELKNENENQTNQIDSSSDDGKIVTESHPLPAPQITLSNEQFEDNIGHHRINGKINENDGWKFVSEKNPNIAKWRSRNGSEIINNGLSDFNILLRPGWNNKGKIIYKSSTSFVIFADDDDNDPNNDKMDNKQANIDASTSILSSNASLNDDWVRNKINASLLVNLDKKSDANASLNGQLNDKISIGDNLMKFNRKMKNNNNNTNDVDHVNNDGFNNYQWPSKKDYNFANETSNSVPNEQYERFNCANSNDGDCNDDNGNNFEMNEDVSGDLQNFDKSHSHNENVFGRTKNETSYSKGYETRDRGFGYIKVWAWDRTRKYFDKKKKSNEREHNIDSSSKQEQNQEDWQNQHQENADEEPNNYQVYSENTGE